MYIYCIQFILSSLGQGADKMLKPSTFDEWKGEKSPTRAMCDLIVLMQDNYMEQTAAMMKSVYDASYSKLELLFIILYNSRPTLPFSYM